MTEAYSDFHSHLVPGVDDGSRTLDEALHSVDRMVGAGVSRIITTPHFRASSMSTARYGDPLAFLDRQWCVLRDAARKAYPHLDLRLGLEVRLDVPDPDLSDPRLRLGGTPFTLVEWPMFTAPPGAPEVLARLVRDGFIPVVAHPERYYGIDGEMEVVRDWKEAGAFLQGSYGSLAGQYGRGPKARVLRLLEMGLLDYLSSDFHGRPEYTFYLKRGVSELQRRGGGGHLDLLAKVNPARLFRGELPLPVPPLVMEEPVRHLLRSWLDD
ncbi:MAG: hypothetical protein OXE96_11750 [Gemmatimonadetes bacterium]|nr:hypothetical protein [Gemmatimonadota bacterium]